MALWGKLMEAGKAAIVAAKRVFEEQPEYTEYKNRAAEYALLWSYYNNSMFDRVSNAWSAYKAKYNLYRNIRMIYNPTKRLVDFYAGVVYPGALSEDGRALPDGAPVAIPFSSDTPTELVQAIAQFWAWNNWQSRKSVIVRYGAALGSVLIELIDDIERGKITSEIVWPGYVKSLELDAAGNIKGYVIEYTAKDEAGSYQYRKEVDKGSFRYFRDDRPYDYGFGAEIENPYGFVPAVWIRHCDTGSDHGSPAIAGSLGKIDELNNLVSHIHDQVHKVIGAPLVLWTDGNVNNLFGAKKRGSTNDFDEPASEQESLLMLKGPKDGKVDSLAGNLDLSAANIYIDKLLAEIEQDHPELIFYRELRSMSQVTGPAASRLVGDVASRVQEAQANYDQACISLFRMACAMGGFRANSGAWGRSLTRQQQKFLPFSLESYQRGELDMSIMPRPLLTPTRLEQAQEKQAIWQGVNLAVQAGAPLEFVLRGEGWTDEELAQLGQDRVEQIKRDQLLAQEDIVPGVEQ
uniref:Phage portal protein n=1 Tax=Thermosporothrix sp. COM3 TaxID=2490863 RepID=A0A455SVW5_9CHLR|nr:hypothetical protein KTC_49010 [Thermosporothrix sp. COM3]BBH90215.1 hypothetical protein KTC_49660 [Thermosporothrix sp. COM3]BBH90280.1 hypothetical protein KTC_50310 [Thermosporothrix sp. COM3]